MTPRSRAALTVVAASALVLAGCATSDPESAPADDGVDGAGVEVLASFYPLQYVAERVGGDGVVVDTLTPPGAEPHDVELSPRQVRTVGESDLVVYLSGFQPAVDEAVTARTPGRVVDAAEVVGGSLDQHFWLDPELLAAVVAPVAAALTEIDPTRADDYAKNAAALEGELADLTAELQAGLASCERKVVVTPHESFGYLTAKHGLEQVGMSGLDPDSEPSPARLREIGDIVRAEGVTTIFSEPLGDPEVARTLASDLGIEVGVLDPLENQTDPDSDYRGVMEQNLRVLRDALGCA
ncbi:metal ABC transporter substrate-binding protein [Cellulomonas fimi]|nr:metal ABC transporter substrate-binding protein [Cellulomonas fimi]